MAATRNPLPNRSASLANESGSTFSAPVAIELRVVGPIHRSAFAVSVTGVLAYRSGGAQQRQLVWMDRAGNLTGKVGGVDDTALSNPTLTADGQRVAVGRSPQGNADTWLVDVARGVASRFTFGPGSENSPVWSPDGRRIRTTSRA